MQKREGGVIASMAKRQSAPATASIENSVEVMENGVIKAKRNFKASGLTMDAAMRLSENPSKVLTTGMSMWTNRLKSVNLISVVSDSELHMGLAYWGMLGYASQLESQHLLTLASSWDGQPIERFGNLIDKCGSDTGIAQAKQFLHAEEKCKELPIDESVIGNYVERLASALNSFGFLVSNLFQLKIEICEAIKRFFAKFVALGRLWAGDTRQDRSGKSLLYLGNLASELLNLVYSGVFSGNLATTAAMIGVMDSMPDAERRQKIQLDMLRSTVTTQQKQQEPVVVGKNHAKNREKRDRKALRAAGAATESPGTIKPDVKSPTTKLLCGYFCSTQGCKMTSTDCSRSHRDPKPTDEELLAKFFATGGPGATLKRKAYNK